MKEREDVSLVESKHGFATYSILNDGSFYIIDIYVDKEHRKSGEATQLESEIISIAKKAGSSKLIGSVCLTANGVTESLNVLLRSGYKFLNIDQQKLMMYFVKEI
jgi:predicted GNAT family acetyltransferase